MGNLLIVDVPEGADLSKLHIVVSNGDHDLLLKNDHGTNDYLATLPPGSWTIVEQTEEGAAKIMPKINDEDESYGWEHFMSDEEFEKHDRVDALPTALASLHSWIRSQGKEPKTSIILKKEI
jgi:hypothetical protein